MRCAAHHLRGQFSTPNFPGALRDVSIANIIPAKLLELLHDRLAYGIITIKLRIPA